MRENLRKKWPFWTAHTTYAKVEESPGEHWLGRRSETIAKGDATMIRKRVCISYLVMTMTTSCHFNPTTKWKILSKYGISQFLRRFKSNSQFTGHAPFTFLKENYPYFTNHNVFQLQFTILTTILFHNFTVFFIPFLKITSPKRLFHSSQKPCPPPESFWPSYGTDNTLFNLESPCWPV